MGTEKKQCIACHEAILARARICRYCGSSQQPAKWQTFGTILKWMGGITAVISLVMASASVNELIADWREQRQTVAELVSAAELQEQSGNYSLAWSLLEDALELSPGSQAARYQRIRLATRWLRTIPPYNAADYSELVEQLLPPMFIGAAQDDLSLRADVLAHIGWGNFLLSQAEISGLAIDGFYLDALQLEPDNPFANAMRGYSLVEWSDTSNDGADIALTHFDTALATGEEYEFVNFLLFEALDVKDYDNAFQVEFMHRYQQLAPDDPQRLLRRDYARRLIRNLLDPEYSDSDFKRMMGERFTAEQLLETWKTVSDPNPGSLDLYVEARLTEQSGDPATARLLLEQAIAGANRGFERYLDLFNTALQQLPDP